MLCASLHVNPQHIMAPTLPFRPLLQLTILFTAAVSFVGADFHVVNVHEFSGGQAIYLVPSNNMGCDGVQSEPIAQTQYPDCDAEVLRVPDTQCGWSGATIRPNCYDNYDNYFGKLYDGSGEEQGDCYWSDSGKCTFSFACRNGMVFDRLVCYTSMCGNQLIENRTDV